MQIQFKPWMRREAGEYHIEKETALALLLRPVGGNQCVWTPRAGVANMDEVKATKNQLVEATRVKGSDNLEAPVNVVLPCWRHQLEAYVFVRKMWTAGEGCLLDFGMGTGKTKITIDALQNTDVGAVLIMCPKSVVANWPREFAKHGVPGRFLVVALDKYSVEKKAEIAEQTVSRAKASGKVPVVVINYESAWREGFSKVVKHFDTAIMDESHRIKSSTGKASRFCAKVVPKCKYRLALTGTPMPHSPLDIYGQYRALCPAVYGTRWTLFRARYAVMGGFEGRQVVGYQNESEMREKYLSRALQCSRDVLDLPDALHITREVELTPATMRIYRDMDKELVADVRGGLVTASNALSRLLRLSQITGGSVPTTEGHGVRVGSEKQEDLEDILDALAPQEPVVVFCRFHADMDAVHDAARAQDRPSLELSGRKNELAQWQAGAAPVLAVQIQAGGVGIDLTRACYVVYYSVGYSLGDYLQSEARAHRPGQDRAVTFYHLVARGTVDEKIYSSLEKKQNIIESIIGELKELTKDS